ncbi:glycerate kinase [Vibrio chagasii]|nr:glycerate kinase [Vibrio chagasii]
MDCTSKCKEVTFVVACDVNNPLCGESGASAVFGPAGKGASKAQVEQQLDIAIITGQISFGHHTYGYQSSRDTAGFVPSGTPLG